MNKVRATALVLSVAGKMPQYLSKQLAENEFKLLCDAYDSLQREFDLTQLGYLLSAEDVNRMMQSLPADGSTSRNQDSSFSAWLDKAANNITPHAYEVFRKLSKNDATLG